MKIKTLDQTHPNYNALGIAKRDALYSGGDKWHAQVAEFIPKNAEEPTPLWVERQNRATYENNAGPIIDLISAWLFSEAAQVAGLGEGFLGDVDRRSTGWSAWWAQLFVSAQVQRRAFAWVNLPARSPVVAVASRADEEKAGLLNAYLVALDAEKVLDWGDDEAGRLAWVMVKSCDSTRAGPEAERAVVHRWRFIDGTTIRTWEWRPTATSTAPKPDDDAQELVAIQHGIGALPVVRLELAEGLWTMGKLSDPVIAHVRASNDLDWSLHRAAHALMVIAIRDIATKPTLGAGYFLQVLRDKDGVDTVSYAEPTGASFDAQAKNADSKREAIYRVVQQMAMSASQDAAPTKLSGASKAMDWQSLQVMLAAYAVVLLTAMREIATIVGKIRGVTDVEVSGLEGWQQEDIAALLEQAVLAVPLVPSPTYKREMAKLFARRLLPDVDAKITKAIDAEIDAAEFVDPAPYVPPKRPGTPGEPGADEGGAAA